MELDLIMIINPFDSVENVNQTFPKETEKYQQLISDEEMWYLNLYLNSIFCGMASLFGTVNNMINVIIFFQLGLKDSMGVCLFFLAVTDCFHCFVVLSSRVFPIWDIFFHTEHIDPMTIWYVGFDFVSDSSFLCSGWITTFLAVERSVCVTFPFKVKQIFTRNRAIAVVMFIYLTSAMMHIPVYMSNWLEWVDVKVRVGNATVVRQHLELRFSENRPDVEFYLDIVSGNIMPFSSLTIILGSVCWMVYGLNRSIKLRSTMTTTSGTSSGAKADTEIEKQDNKLNNKTRRLVKVVLFLAIIFTTCSIPRSFAMQMYIHNDEVRPKGKESNMYAFQWDFTSLATVMNASVNIFVYLKINSNYRAKFKALFNIKSWSK